MLDHLHNGATMAGLPAGQRPRRPRRWRWLSRTLLTLLALPVIVAPAWLCLRLIAPPSRTANQIPPAMRTERQAPAATSVREAAAKPVWGQPISGLAGAGSADGSGPGFGQPPVSFYRPGPGNPDGTGQDAVARAGTGILVYYPAGSASSQAAAGQVTTRLQPVLGQAAASPTGSAPPGAVIRYRSEADHAAARSVGALLGQMGYSWRIAGRTGGTGDTGPAVTVWLPAR